MPNSYVTTLRLPVELYEEVELVARVEDKTVSEVIREAIAAYIDHRQADLEFRVRLKERIVADQKILKRLERG